MIRTLKLKNFRSWESLQLHFNQRKTLLIGANGSGKSSILEGIAFLSLLRSFRTAKLNEMIRNDAPTLAAAARLEIENYTERIAVEYPRDSGRGNPRRLFVNGESVSSGRDFIRFLLAVVLSPEDLELVTGSAGVRRKFFDAMLSVLSEEYLNALHDYLRALKLRNALLKRRNASAPEQEGIFEAYERILAENAFRIASARRDFIELFNQELQKLSAAASSLTAEVRYQESLPGTVEEIQEGYRNSRKKELERRVTLSGVHLDEIGVFFERGAMRSFASNGQCRQAALQLKLAQVNLFRQLGADSGKKLLVLVDDVTGELDARNRELFFQTISGADQMIFTFTEMPRHEFFHDAERFDLTGANTLNA